MTKNLIKIIFENQKLSKEVLEHLDKNQKISKELWDKFYKLNEEGNKLYIKFLENLAPRIETKIVVRKIMNSKYSPSEKIYTQINQELNIKKY